MLDLSHRLFLDNDWILRFAGYSDIMHKLVYFEFINTGFSVAKATLESQMSVCLSVTKNPEPLRIAPID